MSDRGRRFIPVVCAAFLAVALGMPVLAGAVQASVGTKPATVTVSAAKPIVLYGSKGTLNVAVHDTSYYLDLLPGATVRIDRSFDATTWSSYITTTTPADGVIRVETGVPSRMWVRAVFAGNDTYAEATSTPPLELQRYAKLSTPSCPAAPRRNVAFKVTGMLWPRHTSGTRPLKLKCYRANGTTWKLYRTPKASVVNAGSGSRYTASATLPYAGRWKIVGWLAADSLHAATSSSAKYVTCNPSKTTIEWYNPSRQNWATKLRAKVLDPSAHPVSGRTVVLEHSYDGGTTWKQVAHGTTGSSSKPWVDFGGKNVGQGMINPGDPLAFHIRVRFDGDTTVAASVSRKIFIDHR